MRISHLVLNVSIVFLLAAGGCNPFEQPLDNTDDVPSLTLSAVKESFINGTAYISLQLSSVSQTDVIVSLSASGDIDPKLLSFDNPVTIKSGNTSAAVVVVVKDEGLQAGEYNVIIAIEGAAGAKVALPSSVRLKYTVEIQVVELKPHLRNDWRIAFVEDRPNEAYDGYIQTVMRVSGFLPLDGSGYYISYGDAGFAEKEYGGLEAFLKAKEEDIAYAIEHNDPYSIRQEDAEIKYTRFPAGSFDFYMLGCGADGHLTGDYTQFRLQRNPTDQMKSIYSKWLRYWEIHGAVWEVSAKNANSSYLIRGIGGVDQAFTAYLGWNGELEIRGDAYVDIDESTWYGLYGIYQNKYTHHQGPVAIAVLDEHETSAQWTGGYNPATGSPFEAIGIYESATGNWTDVPLPEFMCLNHSGSFPDNGPAYGRYAPYEAFLGRWQYDGETFIVSQKVWNKSYSIQVYSDWDDEPLEAVIDYDPNTGTASIAEQDLWTEPYDSNSQYVVSLSGAWYNADKGELLAYYPLVVDKPGSKVGTFIYLKDGTVTCSTAEYGDYSVYALGIWGFVISNGTGSYVGSHGWMAGPMHLIGSGFIER